jgi:hypothetical protein
VREAFSSKIYHDINLTTGVRCRATFKKHYGLYPANYYTPPGMNCDALLKQEKNLLQLLSGFIVTANEHRRRKLLETHEGL